MLCSWAGPRCPQRGSMQQHHLHSLRAHALSSSTQTVGCIFQGRGQGSGKVGLHLSRFPAAQHLCALYVFACVSVQMYLRIGGACVGQGGVAPVTVFSSTAPVHGTCLHVLACSLINSDCGMYLSGEGPGFGQGGVAPVTVPSSTAPVCVERVCMC